MSEEQTQLLSSLSEDAQSEPAGCAHSEPACNTPSEPGGGAYGETVSHAPSEPAGGTRGKTTRGASSTSSKPAGGTQSEPTGVAQNETACNTPSEPGGGTHGETVSRTPNIPEAGMHCETTNGAPSKPAGGTLNEQAGGAQNETACNTPSEQAAGTHGETASRAMSEPADGIHGETASIPPSVPAGGTHGETLSGTPCELTGGAHGDTASGTPNEPVGSAQKSQPATQKKQPPLCKFYSTGRYCTYGRRCRFSHQLPEGRPYAKNARPEQKPKASTNENAATDAPEPQNKNDVPALQKKSDAPTALKESEVPSAPKESNAPASQKRSGPIKSSAPAPPKDSNASAPQKGSNTAAPQSKKEARPTPPRNPPNFVNRLPQNWKLCRYFASGYCSKEAYCRFWHPEMFPPIYHNWPVNRMPPPKVQAVNQPANRKPPPKEKSDNQPANTKPPPKEKADNQPANRKSPPKEKAERPPTLPEVIRAADVTPESAAQLRQTEIAQLVKRFPKDKVIVQEREDGKVTYYRLTVVPTDPDWPFDLKEMEILVEFPEDYPLEVFTIQIPEDQDLPSVMGRHVWEASKAWIWGKHATNQLTGKVELLFRPFLHWLDRNMERLFTEGARLLKRDLEAEKAGLEFVPYQQLQASIADKSGEDADGEEESTSEEEDDDSDSWTSCDEDEGDPEPGAAGDGMTSVEGGGGGPSPRKGTEISFLGLKLGQGVGTLTTHCIVVSLRCSRCNVIADLSLTGKQPCAAQCEKCSSRIAGTFLPSILHQYSSVLGFVDIQGAAAKDLVLRECTFMVGCLNCSHEEPVQNLSFGVTKDLNCLNCHSKHSIAAEGVRFQKVQRYPNKAAGTKDQRGYGRKKLRDPAIVSGKPLPDHGTCKHYRKSCRWFRFPCCGKAYACDTCHDEAENHIMELATRMLCGYCAKEQPFNPAKPCISCGSMMNKNMQSAHWEGGRGCRSKVKMSRKDKQKYANSSKTVSRKSVAKK